MSNNFISRNDDFSVCHVGADLSKNGAGVAKFVEVLSACQSIDYSVSVLSISSGPKDSGCQDFWEGARLLIINPFFFKSMRFSPRAFFALLHLRPSVVHLHGLWTLHSIPVILWHFITGRPYLVSTHGMLASEALKFSSFRKRIALFLFQKLVLEKAAYLHVTSEAEFKDVQVLGFGERAVLVPAIVEMPDNFNSEVERRGILYFGRLHPIKGVELLLSAWGLVCAQFPLVELRICGAGDYEYTNRIREFIEVNRIERVHFEDAVWGKARFDVLSSAEILVVPSLSENFGLVVGEALAVETPVLTSTATPWRYLNDYDCGFWADRSIVSFAEHLKFFLSLSKAAQRRMGANGRRLILDKFGTDKISSEFLELYMRCE